MEPGPPADFGGALSYFRVGVTFRTGKLLHTIYGLIKNMFPTVKVLNNINKQKAFLPRAE